MSQRSAFETLLRPILTEKSQEVGEEANQVVFEVPLDANKVEIRSAVESIYGVTVAAVNTSVRRGKWKRRGKTMGKLPNRKRAVVTLAGEDSIDFFAEEGA